jgi:hypothetical protein
MVTWYYLRNILPTTLALEVAVFKETKSGVSDIRTVLPETSTKAISCITLESVNGGAFEESAETGTVENEKFEQSGKAIEVLLMNK